MTSFFNLNLNASANSLATLRTTFQKLRKIPFAIESTFEFQVFDPKVNWGGMTITTIALSRAKYIRLNKLLLFSFDIQATLAAPLANIVKITLPELCVGAGLSSSVQACAAEMANAGAGATGTWTVYGGSNTIDLQITSGAAFGAGLFRGSANGFIEVN